MKQLFLYRLLRHSKTAFLFAILFISCFAVTFYKKMDMVFFPYNSMYSIDFNKASKTSTYAAKINGRLVRITPNLYWKKDFLETSLNGYCRYIQHDNKTFLEDYIHYKFSDVGMRNFLLNQLTPGKAAASNWPAWYVDFAGYKPPPNATLELMRYEFSFDQQQPKLTDSISLYKTILP